MRRREKFVLASVLLSAGLLAVQYVPLEFKAWAVMVFTAITYLVSAWALKDDLQRWEWLTIVPFPALYAAATAWFYFLLPENFASRVFLLVFFGIGMYALYLTSNIYSVAKGRTIQLLYAAHAIGLFFTLLVSLLFTNTIYSLRLPFYAVGGLIALVHFPLIFMSLWSIRLAEPIRREELVLAGVLTLLLTELAMVLSFFPFTAWQFALFIMSFLYMGLGLLSNYLRGRLFSKTFREYSLLAIFVLLVFLLVVPLK